MKSAATSARFLSLLPKCNRQRGLRSGTTDGTFKARLVLYLRRATGQGFLFVRVMLGESAFGPSTGRHRVFLAALIALMILTTELFLAWEAFQSSARLPHPRYPSTVIKKRSPEEDHP
jgi:hypothetical protein